MTKFFRKPKNKLCFIPLLVQVWALIFYSLKISSQKQKVREFQRISKKAGRTERWMDKQKRTFCRTTTLHSGPTKQAEIFTVAEEGFLNPNHGTIASNALIFRVKHFDSGVWPLLSSNPESKFSYTWWAIW